MKTQVHFRSKVKKLFIEQVVEFLAQKLRLNKRNFELDVIVRKNLAKNNGYNGAAQKHAPGEFLLFVDSGLDAEKMIQVLAHEMVHINQLVLGQLRIDVDEYGFATHYWRGKKCNEAYFDRPWEIDAWAKERLLAIQTERFMWGEADVV